VKTDVLEYPRIVAQALPDDMVISAQVDSGRYDPLVGGVQIQSHQNSRFVGTLGTVLYDTKNRRVLGLTNWHVLYPWAPPGGAGDGVFQPFEWNNNQIGTTVLGRADGAVDAAAFSISGRAFSLAIEDIGAWSGKLSAVTLGTAVRKRGRTTGLTEGTVSFVNATITVDYGGGNSIRYTNQIGVSPASPSTPFADHGDSGSLVLDTAGNRLLSLHFAGNGIDGWGCPIDAVEQALDFRVVPDSTDTGVFNTMDVRPWNLPQLVTSKAVVFAQPYPAPPTLALGLTEIDIGNNANVRIEAAAGDVTTTGFTTSLNAWADTTLYSAGSTWLEVAAADTDFQVGTFNTQEDHPWNQPQLATSRRINFARAYAAPPEVIVWLNELDVDNKANVRVSTYVSGIDASGFTVHIDTWADTVLNSAGVTWIAYPAGKAGVASGTYKTQDVRPWNQPRPNTSGAVTFPPGRFTTPPRVLAALCALDVDRQADLRVNATIDNITATGLTWNLDSWADTVLYSAGGCYIAIGS
jgi:hypothetical protein